MEFKMKTLTPVVKTTEVAGQYRVVAVNVPGAYPEEVLSVHPTRVDAELAAEKFCKSNTYVVIA